MTCPAFHTPDARQRRMQRMVAAMQLYVSTYTEQTSYMDYSDETFINDMLYGIALALDRKQFYASTGFDRFKKRLRGYLPAAIRWSRRTAKPGAES